MEYVKIIAVTGMPGLYEMLSNKGDGAIVKSLDDHSTKFVSGRVHNFTHLESIEVYTQRENVNLSVVLNAMKDSGEKLPDERDNKALQAYFKKVYPELDFDRVYASDMKKMVKWLSVLQKNDVDIKLSEPEPEEEEPAEVEEVAPVVKEVAPKPAKKAKAKEEVVKEKEEPPVKAKAAKPKQSAEKPAKPKEKEAAAPKKKAAPKKAK